PLHSVSSVSASCLLPLSFCSARARSAISTFSLHDALPICYYEFRVLSIDEREQRVRIEAEVVHTGRLRDFFGFNRAKHAVVEAAILATRTDFLPLDQIDSEFAKLGVLVAKTGGAQEKQAFACLQAH